MMSCAISGFRISRAAPTLDSLVILQIRLACSRDFSDNSYAPVQVKTATAGEGSGYWPLVQLLLIVTTLAGVVLLPSLTAHLPHFNAHILPSMPHTVSSKNFSHAPPKAS